VSKSLREKKAKRGAFTRKGWNLFAEDASLIGSNTPRSVQAPDGSQPFKDGKGAMRCKIAESVKPGGRSIGNRLYRLEGIHEERITAKEQVGWKQFPINQEFTSGG